jgi:methylated-DNA-[protein]-cysteine S-methyltransferase
MSEGMGEMHDQSKAEREFHAFRRLALALRALPMLEAPDDLPARALARVRGAGAAGEAAIRFSALDTELGRIYLAYGPRGVRFVAPAESPEGFAEAYAARFGVAPVVDDGPPAGLLADAARALEGDRAAARRLPLDLEPLGAFERAVLAKALEIPRGEVRTYGWVAREIGQPRALRAVGRALGRNPIPFIIPCHRVVGSGGSLTGYAFGLALKERVLRAEGVDPDELRAAARRGERFRGSRTTRIFCLPTCRNARRIRPGNVVAFRSEDEATSAGYRACRVCRPMGEVRAASG